VPNVRACLPGGGSCSGSICIMSFEDDEPQRLHASRQKGTDDVFDELHVLSETFEKYLYDVQCNHCGKILRGSFGCGLQGPVPLPHCGPIGLFGPLPVPRILAVPSNSASMSAIVF
jgi:hypothetical protein